MKELSKRTKTFTDSVIRRMTRIANQYDAINLSQGFPDFDPPKEILNRLEQVAHEDYNQYAITWGAQNFRDALAKKQSKYMNLDLDSNKNIVITCINPSLRIQSSLYKPTISSRIARIITTEMGTFIASIRARRIPW